MLFLHRFLYRLFDRFWIRIFDPFWTPFRIIFASFPLLFRDIAVALFFDVVISDVFVGFGPDFGSTIRRGPFLVTFRTEMREVFCLCISILKLILDGLRSNLDGF